MEHQYCLFYKNDKLQFGWIREVRKNKLVVIPEQGKEFNCAPSRVEYIWKGKILTEEKEALEYLLQKADWSRNQSRSMEIDVIHELCDPGTPYTIDELAENFLDEYENGWLRTALLLSLKSDNKLFQQKKSQFFARSGEEIAVIEEQEEKKREVEKRQAIETEWAQTILEGKTPAIEDSQTSHWDQFIHRFRNFVVHLERSQEKDYFCTLFQCQLKDTERVERKLLDDLAIAGYPMSWGRLVLKRASVDFTLEPKEKEESEQLLTASIQDSRFQCKTLDQRSLNTYTVDHQDTRDFDDALSFEKTENGSFVRVHITDVASLVPENHALFELASERCSSLYTIKETYSMFAPILSEGLFSLKQESERATLTFEFCFDEQGDLVKSEIYRSLISVDKNLSYEEIDRQIEENSSFWADLWNICNHQASIRRENGSLELDRYEVKLDISDPGNIKLKSIRENTPASLMIQELAILTNHLAATYARDNELPCLYRNQPPYSVSKSVGENEKPTLKDINIQPARVSLNPEGHSALGLDCYLQISSPIRRFLDLVNQTIIMTHMGNGESSFSQETLLEWARRGEEVQREFVQIERKLSDHWKIKYLEQHRDELFEAQFIRTNRNGRAQIVLTLLQLMLEMPMESIPEEEIFKVRLDRVDSRTNRISVRWVASEELTKEEQTPIQE